MDIIRGCLDIIFRKLSCDEIIKSIFEINDKKRKILHDRIDKNIFINVALDEFKYYSENEVINIYECLLDSMKDMRELSIVLSEKNKFFSVFNLLIGFAEDVLIERNGQPFCKYENMIRWRMMSHKLDQDIFTTAYFAYRDVLSSQNRTYFAWETIIRSDNNRLHTMLKKGISENHFHLKGSAPYFNLTWISLMNRIINRRNDFIKSGIMQKKLEPELYFSEEIQKSSIYNLVKKAAIIRMFLFSKLKDIKLFKSEDELKELINKDELFFCIGNVQDKINILNYEYGYKFKTNRNLSGEYIDYCIPKNLYASNINSNRFLVGERIFMYNILKKIYERDKSILKYINLFYVYLVIKAKFRSELIQINDRVGFKNFSDYQDRKTVFLKKEPILREAIYSMAIMSTMKEQNVKKLEVRICPENTSKNTAKEINNIDKIIEKEEKDLISFTDINKLDENITNTIYENYEHEQNNNYFFVIHFPKSEDKLTHNLNIFNKRILGAIVPRDYEKRRYVRKQASDLVRLREEMNSVVSRIVGIDACANEIGCRPEVFSQAFRYLSNHTNRNNLIYYNNNRGLPQLKMTYHVGEDFLDLVDGLRAIDESIKFLGLRYGDRIGHGLALGINVKEWYEMKHYKLILSKQDYLDNIVWMLNKIREFGIHDIGNLVYELERLYNQLFQEIYQDNFTNEEYKIINFDFNTYYDAWKLRGDDPELYIEGSLKKNINICYWDRCKLNNLIDEKIRKNNKACYIYYNYHFNTKVKEIGLQKYEFTVDQNYIKAAKEIQRNMQIEVSRRGIAIETNPSSNYLIGTFKRYDKHPIINFYNLGLVSDYKKVEQCPQLFVSINTDDQGVFGTCIENEYELMAIALEKARDENGNLIYNQSMIYDWLNRIRQMGLEQSFITD